ncbi:hypothetical protein ACETAC_07420 [Aceticella autotrophica]|uniref:Uncharacterized protein n=1 Tax=Aceticella autotrophica TaxID=2755338 RepID=A0A975AUL1_9THEO|nr:hypothetical protein [Aceticella autotrophica]QSZ26722.1 hypothetical protein ACETAC_07420 [Aceticella autotrophica]
MKITESDRLIQERFRDISNQIFTKTQKTYYKLKNFYNEGKYISKNFYYKARPVIKTLLPIIKDFLWVTWKITKILLIIASVVLFLAIIIIPKLISTQMQFDRKVFKFIENSFKI